MSDIVPKYVRGENNGFDNTLRSFLVKADDKQQAHIVVDTKKLIAFIMKIFGNVDS